MQYSQYLWVSLLSIGLVSPVFANSTDANAVEEGTVSEAAPKYPRLESLKELKNIKAKDLKVDANAAQPDEVKDPLQPLNRQIYALNDSVDRHVIRPVSVQYKAKVPENVRGSYRLFRKNMGEPWNAVNQVAQGRFTRAAKTLARVTINTVTTLGLADPARRLGLSTEEESLGDTLGYYGVPSGPYIMLPVLGPSTFRNALDYPAESYAKPLTYIFDNNNQDGLAWGNTIWGGIDTRANLLDAESVLQGDRYAAIRDIYLQHKKFEIAQKKGDDAGAVSFIDDGDDFSDEDSESSQNPSE